MKSLILYSLLVCQRHITKARRMLPIVNYAAGESCHDPIGVMDYTLSENTRQTLGVLPLSSFPFPLLLLLPSPLNPGQLGATKRILVHSEVKVKHFRIPMS